MFVTKLNKISKYDYRIFLRPYFPTLITLGVTLTLITELLLIKEHFEV